MYIAKATAWWNAHVLTGTSPAFDEKKDAEILKVLRTNSVDTTDATLTELLGKAEQLKTEIETVMATLDDKQKELKVIVEQIKKYALSQFRDGDTKVAIRGNRYEWVLSKSDSTELDKDSLKADGLLAKYTKIKTNYRLTTSEIKED
jgi:predicted phage-related endonuclease